MQINNILVPTDFSDCSVNALRYALRLAEDFKSKISIINAYEIPIPVADVNYSFNPSIYEDYEKGAQAKFALLENDIPRLKHFDVDYKVKMGFTVNAIEDEINDHHIDLVVMGTKGGHNLAETLMGSNTYHVAKKSTCPVLSIPDVAKTRGIANIAIAVDLNHHPDDLSLNFILGMAKRYNASIHFLHVSESPSDIPFEKAWEVLSYKKEFEDIDNQFHFIENKDIEQGINQYLENHNIDLLVLLPNRHTFFTKLFKSSITKKLMLHSQIPLLTI